jgi:hypothetical protein
MDDYDHLVQIMSPTYLLPSIMSSDQIRSAQCHTALGSVLEYGVKNERVTGGE